MPDNSRIDTHWQNRTYRSLKRVLDAVCAALLVIVLLPVFALIAFFIWIDSGRPIFFRQLRAGRKGKLFRIVKFRTIHTGEHNLRDPLSHVTQVGRVLRRYALDEMPQLWNILRTEMSLIGPRPVLPAEARGYGPREQRRLAVRPGLTGWAQVNGRNALTWQQRITHDLWYVDHQSALLDLRILLKTPGALLSQHGVYGPGNLDPDENEVTAHSRRSEDAQPANKRWS